MADERMTYSDTARAAEELGLSLVQADAARYAGMSGTDGTGRLMYDRERFLAAAKPASVDNLNLCIDSYVIGAPVIVELLADGSLRATVDLAEAARPRDVGDEVDWSDEDVTRVCAAVQAALDAKRLTVGAVDY